MSEFWNAVIWIVVGACPVFVAMLTCLGRERTLRLSQVGWLNEQTTRISDQLARGRLEIQRVKDSTRVARHHCVKMKTIVLSNERRIRTGGGLVEAHAAELIQLARTVDALDLMPQPELHDTILRARGSSGVNGK